MLTFLEVIRRLLCRLLDCSQFTLKMSYTIGDTIISGDNLMARIKDNQTIVVSVSPMRIDENGNQVPANLDGNVEFTAEGPAGGSFEQLSPVSARYTPDGVGAVQITVEGDADLDVGEERILTASGALEVVSSSEEADRMEIIFGEPEDA